MIIKIMILTLMVFDHHDHHHPHDVPANVETNQQKQVIEAKATDDDSFLPSTKTLHHTIFCNANTPLYYNLQCKH